MTELERKYLKSLADRYPPIASAATEIINLQAILNLPRRTEHFLTDIHGEYEQFNHVLKNGSGSVRRKIDEEFGNTLSSRDKKSLATLIYYPEEKLDIMLEEEENIEDWYKITLHRRIQITKRVASKYTRSKMHKAITILQFKLEGQLILCHPEFDMENRLLLHKIDYENKTVEIDGTSDSLKDVDFPTVDREDPYRLTAEELKVMERLRQAFLHSEKLQRHVRFLFSIGGLYKVYNSNLLYHGCVPLTEDGSFAGIRIGGRIYSGKALYDILENCARIGYYGTEGEEKRKAYREEYEKRGYS